MFRKLFHINQIYVLRSVHTSGNRKWISANHSARYKPLNEGSLQTAFYDFIDFLWTQQALNKVIRELAEFTLSLLSRVLH